MFGMGGSEIIVILIVALLFLGPDKLPEAAKQISKGIRDIKKQSRSLQQSIENDEQIGGAIRDLKSALRGEDLPVQPKAKKLSIEDQKSILGPTDEPVKLEAPPEEPPIADEAPKLTLPTSAGEADPVEGEQVAEADDAELAALIKPAAGTVAKGS